jgi:hypothetical protein
MWHWRSGHVTHVVGMVTVVFNFVAVRTTLGSWKYVMF